MEKAREETSLCGSLSTPSLDPTPSSHFRQSLGRRLREIWRRQEAGVALAEFSPAAAPPLTSVTHEPLRSRQDDWRRGRIETDNFRRRRRRWGKKKNQNLSEEAAHENGNMKTLRLYFNEEKKTVRGLWVSTPLTANDRGPCSLSVCLANTLNEEPAIVFLMKRTSPDMHIATRLAISIFSSAPIGGSLRLQGRQPLWSVICPRGCCAPLNKHEPRSSFRYTC